MKTFNFLSNAKSLNIQNDKSLKIRNSNQNTSGNNNNEDNSKLGNPKLNIPITQSHTYKKVTEKDCTDLRILVKKSVDDLNDLLNLHEISNIGNNFNHRRENNNGSDILKKKHQSALSLDNNMNKSMKNENKNLSDSKTNFTFNINNFINIPSNNAQKKINRYEEDTERTQSDKQNNSNINKSQKLTSDKIIKSMNSITVNKKIVKNNTMQFNKINNKEKIAENVLNKKISISPNTKVKREEMIKNKKTNYHKKFSQTQKLKNTNTNINILSQKFNSSVSDVSSFNYQSSTPRGSDSKNVTKNNYTRSISSNSNNLIRNVNSTTNIKKHNSSSLSKEKDKLNYHQILDKIYSKKFPYELGNTNDILKLMLFLNEYLINNNLLKDYYKPQNRNLLNEYSKYLTSIIDINYPEAIEINHSELDKVVNSAKIIQRYWRNKTIKKYLGKHNKENHELKKMVVNNYIKKSGYKVKKIIGLYNSLVEDFENLSYYDNDLNEMFHYTKKIINNNLTKYEKNLLYKNFINNIILGKYK
jgi:hypothetical protein